MTLQQMEIFITVARYGSFTAAAKKYYMTQPTISRQISLLEDELGYALVDRQEKPLRLTPAGNTVYQSFSEIVPQIYNVKKMGELAAKGQHGHLSIGFTEDLYIEEYFSTLLDDILGTLEGLKLYFTKIPMPDLKEHLLTRQEDIVISLHVSLLDCDEIGVTDLFPIECFILMSKKHPLASRTQLDPEDLIHENIYLPEPVKCYSIHQDYFCGYHINRANLVPTSTPAL